MAFVSKSPTESTLSSWQGLVSRARDGDAQAFRLIFDRQAPAVRRLLGDLFRDDTAADEATQETFVRAHARLSSLRESAKLTSWLFGIARRVWFEKMRNKKRTAPEELAHQKADLKPGPEAVLLTREADSMLDQALAGLTDQRRAALLMRIDHELGYDEIAHAMDWSLAKVKNEIHRARLQLRALLQGYVGDSQ